jgi:hydroxymethylbilane synthase
VILAAAGLIRLGLRDRLSALFPLNTLLPAVSQGAIGVQIREGDPEAAAWIGGLDHLPTRYATTAERMLLRTLEGGCQVPVGALGELDTGALRLRAVVCSLDGRQAVEGSTTGAPGEAAQVGERLARDLLDRGAEEILEAIRREESGI